MTESSSWTVESSIPSELAIRLDKIKTSPALQKYAQSKSQPVNKYISLFTFLTIIRQLKKTARTGWLNFGIDHPESISDHMYRMGIISMLTSDQGLDTGRCVKMALVHDMAESLVGDITPVDPISKEEKHRREEDTMKYLAFEVLGDVNKQAGQEIWDLWQEYEGVSTKEARFVKDVDKFELLAQTLEYEQDYPEKDLTEFLSVRKQVKSEEVSDWADAALEFQKDLKQ